MSAAVKKRSTRAPGMEKTTLLALAVCSNQEDLRSLADILEADRWTVRHAQTCDEALRLIESENPAVVACEHELASGTFSGDDLTLSPDLELHSMTGNFDLAAGRLRLTGIQAVQGVESYTGQGTTQPDGKMLLELTSARHQVVRVAVAK